MRQKTQWETIRKVLCYIRRYRIYFVASILLASVNVFGTLMIPKLVGEAVDQMLGTGQVFYEGLFAMADCTLYIHGSDCAVVYEPQQ